MTLSDFVKLLYNRIGGGASRADFLVDLTTEIMKKSFTDKDHPLVNKSQDMLGRIFNGSRELPQKDAKVILFNIDRERFVEYLVKLPLHVTASISEDMRKKGLTVSDDEIVDACTDLFISILEGCASGVSASEAKDSSKKTSIPDMKNKKASQAGTPSAQMVNIFKASIFDCNLITILNTCPSATRQAIIFLETIQSDIENNDNFFEYRYEEMYKNIVSFAYTVDHYNRVLNTRDHSVVSFYNALDIEIKALWRRMITLYSEICGANTLFADEPPI